MSGSPPKIPSAPANQAAAKFPSKEQARQARLAKALRDNLKRRKCSKPAPDGIREDLLPGGDAQQASGTAGPGMDGGRVKRS